MIKRTKVFFYTFACAIKKVDDGYSYIVAIIVLIRNYTTCYYYHRQSDNDIDISIPFPRPRVCEVVCC